MGLPAIDKEALWDKFGTGTTILLVEQNAMLALELADYGYVMETGEITFEGDAGALRDSAAVRESYL